MADISKIKLPSGSSYDIKDAKAREDIANLQSTITGAVQFIGVTTTALTDGASTNPITISGNSVTAVNGNLAMYSDKEFVFSSSDNKWHEFGSTGSLKKLAFKDSASASYTPGGTVSKPTFSGTAATLSHTVSGTVDATGKFTPAGTVSTPTITVTLNTASKYVASSATGGGSVTAGSAAACTLPSFTTSVASETLTLGWSAGSFTANTPTAVTLPSFASQTIATSVKTSTSTQPTFTGTEGDVSASVDTSGITVASHSYTPAGTVSQPTFTGTAATITVQ